MRTIKFRAWHKPTSRMYWFDLLWGSVGNSGTGWIGMLPIEQKERKSIKSFSQADDRENLDPTDCIFMQFTGLTDKNGIEIFENDLVNFRANYSSKPCGYMNGQVVFEENQWMLKNENGLYSIAEETDEFYCKSEVIGNAYQNADQTN